MTNLRKDPADFVTFVGCVTTLAIVALGWAARQLTR